VYRRAHAQIFFLFLGGAALGRRRHKSKGRLAAPPKNKKGAALGAGESKLSQFQFIGLLANPWPWSALSDNADQTFGSTLAPTSLTGAAFSGVSVSSNSYAPASMQL